MSGDEALAFFVEKFVADCKAAGMSRDEAEELALDMADAATVAKDAGCSCSLPLVYPEDDPRLWTFMHKEECVLLHDPDLQIVGFLGYQEPE